MITFWVNILKLASKDMSNVIKGFYDCLASFTSEGLVNGLHSYRWKWLQLLECQKFMPPMFSTTQKLLYKVFHELYVFFLVLSLMGLNVVRQWELNLVKIPYCYCPGFTTGYPIFVFVSYVLGVIGVLELHQLWASFTSF